MLFYVNTCFDSNIDEPAFFRLVFTWYNFFFTCNFILYFEDSIGQKQTPRWEYTYMCFVREMPVWKHLREPEEAGSLRP